MAHYSRETRWSGAAERNPPAMQPTRRRGHRSETLERSLALNVQGKRSKVDYLRSFKVNADAINLSGGYTGGSIAATKLVAKEHGLRYNAANAVKQTTKMQEVAKRYLVALVFTGLNSNIHNNLKAYIKYD